MEKIWPVVVVVEVVDVVFVVAVIAGSFLSGYLCVVVNWYGNELEFGLKIEGVLYW